MNKAEKVQEEISRIVTVEGSGASSERKLEELIFLLERGSFDSEQIKKLQSKLNSALDRHTATLENLEEFAGLDEKSTTREEHLVNIESFLLNHQVDSTLPQKIRLSERAKSVTRACIGFLMVTLGFAMIILPAPPNFEMFTIFYFNINDGVTLMDLISLLVVFTGIYLTITSLIKQRRYN